MKLLYVEDELAHVALTRRTLEENPDQRFELLHAETIAGALELLDSTPDIDLILSDLRLPDGSGLDLLAKVNRRTAPPPVVLVTGQGDEQAAVAALKAGAADYLVKQTDYLHRLPVAINNAVAQSRLARGQAALREAEIKYQSLIEQTPVVVFLDLADENETGIYISPRVEELTGYTSNEWLADSNLWDRLIYEEDRSRIAAAYDISHNGGVPFFEEYRIVRRDGRIVWIKENTHLIRDEAGHPLYWQGILLDVTQEKESQAAIQESEERFRRIFHTSPIATCVVTFEDGRFIDANKAFVELIGVPLEQIVGHSSLELGLWKSREDRESFVQKLKEKGFLHGMELQYPNVPNGPRDTVAYYELIELGGNPCVLAMFYDVTDQKKSEKALQAERDFALQILNNMGQGLTVTTADNRLEYINPALANMLGYSQEEMAGKQPTDFTSPKSLPTLQEQRKLRREGKISAYESNLLHKDGHEVPVIVTGVPRWRNDEVAGAIAVFTDLTAIKRAETSLARQVKELTVLHSAAMVEAEIAASEDEIIERITNTISQIHSEVCGILLLNNAGDILTPHPSYRGADVSNWSAGYPITEGVSGEVVRLGKPIRLGDITRDPAYIEIASGIRSELCVPIRVNERIIGVLNVESKTPEAYDDGDERFLTIIAGGLGSALERFRLMKEEQRRSKESYESELARREQAETLQEVIASLSTTLDSQTLYQTILDSLAKLVKHDSASIFLEYENGDMEIVAARGFSNMEDVVGKKLQKSAKWYELALARKPLIMPDAQADPRFEKWEGFQAIHGWLGVPMIAQDRVIGFINLDSREANAFTEREATIVQTFANSVAIAIGNARLYRDAVRAAERRAVLHQISQQVVRFAEDSEQIYAAIHEAASKLMACDVFTISLRNTASGKNDFVYRVEGSHRYPFESIAVNTGLTSKIISTGASIILHNVEEIEKSGALRFGPPKHVQSAVLVPMRIGERVVGTISAQSYQPHAYGDEEQALLEMLATHAATAIENARLYDETQNRIREMEAINRLSSSLRRTQSQAEMLDMFLDETLDLLGEENGSVWLYDHSSHMIVQRAARGVARDAKHKRLGTSKGIIAHVFNTGEVYTSPDLRNDPLIYKPNLDVILPNYGGLCIPIKSTAGTLGATLIQMASNRQITKYTNLLITLAEITGNAIHRAELFDHSQEQIQRLTALRDIDSAIASSTDLRVTLNILSEHALKHLNIDAMDVLIYRPELQSLHLLCSAGFKAPSPTRPLMRIGEGLAGQVLVKGRTDHVIDLMNSPEAMRDPMLAREGFVTYIGVPLIVKGQIKGVFEAFHRTPLAPSAEWMQFLQTLAGQAAIAIDNAHLFDNLQKTNQELTQAYDITLEGWARALELRDRETEGHTRRVTELTMRLAKSMGIKDEELVNIYRGVLLHDIGKMGVPDQILKKTGPLTESEWGEMRRHPQYAFDLLSPIHYLRPALDIPYCHHEHWDGSGYPRGLKGEQIPLSARIFSVVDIWDALRSDRPYRSAWPIRKVLEYIKESGGTILDPNIVELFLKLIEEDEAKTG
jgi:PAS domain S-box-containing protein